MWRRSFLSITLPGQFVFAKRRSPGGIRRLSDSDLFQVPIHRYQTILTLDAGILAGHLIDSLLNMAIRTLEARLEHLTVKDENEVPSTGSTLLKSKVRPNTAHYDLGELTFLPRTKPRRYSRHRRSIPPPKPIVQTSSNTPSKHPMNQDKTPASLTTPPSQPQQQSPHSHPHPTKTPNTRPYHQIARHTTPTPTQAQSQPPTHPSHQVSPQSSINPLPLPPKPSISACSRSANPSAKANSAASTSRASAPQALFARSKSSTNPSYSRAKSRNKSAVKSRFNPTSGTPTSSGSTGISTIVSVSF